MPAAHRPDNRLAAEDVRENIGGRQPRFTSTDLPAHQFLQKSTKAVLIIGFQVGVGIWFLSFNWVHVRTAQRPDQSSAVIEGRVIDRSTRPLSKGGQSLTVVVGYIPANHAAITKEFDVDCDDYKSAPATGKAKGTYLPDDPQISLVTKFAILPYQVLIGLGGVMPRSGLFCLGHVIKTRRRG